MAAGVSTHQVTIDPVRRVVTKRFKTSSRREPEREWRALTLLAAHAPGLAPAPLRADLSATPPVIEMSWLPGGALGSAALTTGQVHALSRALTTLWQVPAPGPEALTDRENRDGGNPGQLLRAVDTLIAAGHDLGPDPAVRRAYAAALSWLAGARAELESDAEAPAVLGQNDANLANFLWDGQVVRIVDFEDSGRSDRAFELAILVEHVSEWSQGKLRADRFMGMFDLTAAELRRAADFRRLAALLWLVYLRPGGPSGRRNPPGTLRRQADRLLTLL